MIVLEALCCVVVLIKNDSGVVNVSEAQGNGKWKHKLNASFDLLCPSFQCDLLVQNMSKGRSQLTVVAMCTEEEHGKLSSLLLV